MKIFFLLLFSFWIGNTYSQNDSKTFLLEEGCYVRGYYSGSPDNTSFWYIKGDSTFINFHINQSSISVIRKGEWHYLGDSMLSLQYQPLKSTILLNSFVGYHTETKGSADSVYFYGSIKGNNNQPLAFSVLVFDNAKKEFEKFGYGSGLRGITTDVKGNFGFSTHKSHYFGALGVLSAGYYPLVVNTLPDNNYHKLDIILPLKDSTNDIDINKFDEKPEVYKYKPFKENTARKYVSGELGITFTTKDKALLLNELYKARQKQPYLAGPIDELVEYLKK